MTQRRKRKVMKKTFKIALLSFLILLMSVLAFTACGDVTGQKPHTHTPVVDAAVAPTCASTGLTEGKHCSSCGEVLVKQQPVKALAHTEVEDAPRTPTCTEAGLTKGKHCSVCDEVIVAQKTIEAYGHVEVVSDAVAPTCTKSGSTEGMYCSVCGDVIVASTVIPANGHSFGDWVVTKEPTASESGLKRRDCSECDEFETDIIAATVHDHSTSGTTTLEAVAPTCTTPGLTEGKKCSGCGEILVVQNTVPATGHKYKTEVTAPTCTARGYTTHTCDCGDSYKDSYVNATGHTKVTEPAVSPTCTEDGYTKGESCSVCNAVITAKKKVGALGHSYVISEVPGDEDAYAQICSRCGDIGSRLSAVTYEDYGAKGDGVTDDSEAIRKAHNYANSVGLPVAGKAGATYYIGKISQTIVIKTDTNWNGATFIFDDSRILWNDSTHRNVNVFTISPDTTSQNVTIPSGFSIKKGQANIGIKPGETCMLKIENSNDKIYIRFGENKNAGVNKSEMILVDANGNVDPSTPIIYDYTKVTKITKYSIADKAISVGNGKIITRVPDPREQDSSYENNYCFFSRGIAVQRSNVTLYGIEHSIVGEMMTIETDRNGDGTIDKWGDDKSYGVPYTGFFNFSNNYNVTMEDCLVQGHQAYSFYQYNEDTGSTSRNEMGNYDIYANNCIDLIFSNVVQYENKATGETITNRFMYHGIMGTNFCRNMVVDNCYLDRFDAHQGLYGARITNSTIGFGILVIGGGELYVENVHRLSGDAFILLRTDYNSVFDGDVIIKNCTAESSITCIITGLWRSFYNGLPNYMAKSVTIEGLTVGSNKIAVYKVTGAATSALTDSVNKLYLPDSVKISGVKKSNGAEVGVEMSAYNDAFATFELDIHRHTWNDGVVVSAASTTNCTTGVIRYTCTDTTCGATRDGIISSGKPHSSLVHTITDGVITYTCPTCNTSYVPNEGYAMDGSDHSAMQGGGMNANRFYTTADGSDNPLIEDGVYKLLKKNSDDSTQMELWLPSKTYTLDGLTSANNAIGFLSFKINAYAQSGLSMKFIDIKSNEGDNRWNAGGVIVDNFFTVSAPRTSILSKNKVKITGWDGLELWYEKAGSDKFTGWIDVKMIIELSATDDTVTVHYYIDGSYVGTKSKELTTLGNCISGIYLSGYTKDQGSGVMLDDVAFGCSFGKRS